MKDFPSLSEQLRQSGIDPVALIECLEAYAVDVNAHIQLNFDEYAEPLPYLEVTDRQKLILDFVRLIPTLCNKSKPAPEPADPDGDFDDDYDEDYD